MNSHKITLSNIDLNVVLAALELLGKSKKHTNYTREWASDLHGHLKSMNWNFTPDAMKHVMPKD